MKKIGKLLLQAAIDKKEVKKIVITGGPCSGKTTGMDRIVKELDERGYGVLIIPETATELILGGILPSDDSLGMCTFQYVLIKKQCQKEQLYEEVAQMLPYEKIVILLDRGILDSKIYVTEEEFQEVLKRFALNEKEVQNRYDAVFHLVTAADGAEEFYTLSNNSARTETVEEAKRLDKRGISVWKGHPHFRAIDNSTDFEGKIQRLLNDIFAVLNEK